MWIEIYTYLESDLNSPSQNFVDILSIIVEVGIIVILIKKSILKIKKKETAYPLIMRAIVLSLFVALVWLIYANINIIIEEKNFNDRIKNEQFDFIKEGEGEVRLPESGRLDCYYLILNGEEIYVDTGFSTQVLPVGEGRFKAYYIYDTASDGHPYAILVRIDKWEDF